MREEEEEEERKKGNTYSKYKNPNNYVLGAIIIKKTIIRIIVAVSQKQT